MAGKVTIADIAAALGISKSTVSKALSDATDISDEMRRQVLICASRLGYQTRSRSYAENPSVALFLENLQYDEIGQFCHEVILGFQSEAGSAKVGVHLITLEQPDAFSSKYAAVMNDPRYAGSFFIGFRPHSGLVYQFKEIGKPAVLLDNNYDSPLTARIGTDSAVGMRAAVNHLCGLGHRSIAYLGGEKESYVTEERRQGYLSALQAAGIAPDARLTAFAHFYEDFDASLLEQLVKAGATALVCASDIIALNAVKKLRAMGLLVPQDVSVVGYDGIPLTRYSNPPLTTVSQNGLEVGRMAFRLLQSLLHGDRISQLTLRPQLLVRESTAAAAHS